MMTFLNWRKHAGTSETKFYKTDLWQGTHLMLGLNCLEVGQEQPRHSHDGADKFYLVLEGQGRFTIGQEESECHEGTVVIAPAGIPHGVQNNGLT